MGDQDLPPVASVQSDQEAPVRGDTAVAARLLLRGSGLAGLAAALGGLATLVAVLLPWHELVATVQMLDATSSRAQLTRAALPGSWWGWAAAAVGIVAVGLGVGVATDRPVPWARRGLLLAGVVLVGASVAALVWAPDATHLAAQEPRLLGLDDRLPTGVDLTLAVRPSVGPWMSLVAAGLVLTGAVGAREP